MKTLNQVKVGETVKVTKIAGEGPIKRRIMDMGITKGVEIYVRKVAPLGDPVEIKKGSLVSTSGLGKYKSSDLPLGTVTSTQKASDQLGQEIRVKPKANLDVNRYVLLIGE